MFLKIRRLFALYIDFILIFIISYFPFHYIYTLFYTSFMNIFMGSISLLLLINLFLRKDCLIGYESIGKKIMLLSIYQENEKVIDKKLLMDRVAYSIWPFISYPFMILYNNRSKGDVAFNTSVKPKNSKKSIVPIIAIVLIILLTFLWPLFSNKYDLYKANKLASTYDSKEAQLEYFAKNKEILYEMIRILNENEGITKISVNSICFENNYKYIYDDIVVCNKKNNDKIPELDIMKNFKKLKMYSITRYDYDNIEFNLVQTDDVKISFYYCANIETCESNADSQNNKIADKNIIDDYWFTSYNKIN